ncbi:MAG: hypothetical protein II839_00165, partial [Kiritimatiellae bacterium]|nr:hypothetical protein [Kiritimatiellia bacterium]
MDDDSIVKIAFAAVWVAIALAGPILSHAKKKRERREEADTEALETTPRDAGGAPRPRVVLRPRPAASAP